MDEFDEVPVIGLLVASDRERYELIEQGSATRLSKPGLVAMAGAMKRAFASTIAGELLREERSPGLLIGLFQHGDYFEAERARYAAFAASGQVVIAGFPDAPKSLPGGIVGVDTAGRSELREAWVLVTLASAFGGTLVAVDEQAFADAPRFEAARLFTARASFRRREAVEAARATLAPLRTRLSDRSVAEAERALRAAEQLPWGAAEDALATALEEALLAMATPPAGTTRTDVMTRDLLTGLPNRRYLERYLGRSLGGTPVGALMIDVDNLGALNERCGREAGDGALVALATALSDERGAGETLVRLDEDEFLLLLPGADASRALEVAERIVVSVRALRLPYPFGAESITCSIGVAEALGPRLPEQRLREALERAKVLGKNGAQLAKN